LKNLVQFLIVHCLFLQVKRLPSKVRIHHIYNNLFSIQHLPFDNNNPHKSNAILHFLVSYYYGAGVMIPTKFPTEV
jgi:hypothetical protein